MERFEVLVVDFKTPRETRREWSGAELLKGVPWLRHLNARGGNVFIRPAGQHGLVLLDGLGQDDLDRLGRRGFEPASTIQTGPGAFQAWVKLSERPLPEQLRRLAAAGVEMALGRTGDNAAAGQYGRLAGFTNQCPKLLRNGRQPYVLVHGGAGKVATDGPAHVERIHQGLGEIAVRKREQEKSVERGQERGRSPRR